MDNTTLKYLKSESYYSDLYDRFTVEKCRRWGKNGESEDTELKKDFGKNEAKKIKQGLAAKLVIPVALYFIKGERYAQKAKTIREWMDADREKDELLASAAPPRVQCLKCGSALVANYKDLHSSWPDEKDRVLFMYDCPNGCLPRRAFFNDGEEWRPKRHLCPKCDGEVKEENLKDTEKITTIYTCLKCGNKEEEIFDLNPKREPEKTDPDFEKDRQRFCMTKEEGDEYIESKVHLENFSRLTKEIKEKEEVQKKLVGIKKLPVAGLRDLLSPLLEKEGYIKLEFAKPEIDRDVIIQFDIQDSQSIREEYDSVHRLQKIIKLALDKTNWRLMSEGVYYKLGILSGRLRGYENDEDLLKLVK